MLWGGIAGVAERVRGGGHRRVPRYVLEMSGVMCGTRPDRQGEKREINGPCSQRRASAATILDHSTCRLENPLSGYNTVAV